MRSAIMAAMETRMRSVTYIVAAMLTLAVGLMLLPWFLASSHDSDEPAEAQALAVVEATETPAGERAKWKEAGVDVDRVLREATYPRNGVFLKNRLSKVNGLGLNVATCVEVLGLRCGYPQMAGFQDWAANEPGGSYPEKNLRQIAAFCKAKETRVPAYVQYEKTAHEVVAKENARGKHWLMVSDRGGPESFYRARVLTAVLLIYIDDQSVCLHDPNWANDARRVLFWISRDEFNRRFDGWVFAFRDASE